MVLITPVYIYYVVRNMYLTYQHLDILFTFKLSTVVIILVQYTIQEVQIMGLALVNQLLLCLTIHLTNYIMYVDITLILSLIHISEPTRPY